MRIAVDFKCLLASCHSCAFCGALCFCEWEWSSATKPGQLGWARTVGGEIWARNKLNLANTFSFRNMLHVSLGRQTAVKWFGIRALFKHLEGFPGGWEVKASACNEGDLGSIPGWGKSSGEGNGNPLQYSCLENPMDGGAWWATVHRVTKSQTWLSNLTDGERHFPMSTCTLNGVLKQEMKAERKGSLASSQNERKQQ